MEIIASFWWIWMLMCVVGTGVMLSSVFSKSGGSAILKVFGGWAIGGIGYVLFILSMILNIIDYAKH